MNAPIRPCLGGWCSLRGKCAHHEQPTVRYNPAERLCDQGHEMEMFFAPLTSAHANPVKVMARECLTEGRNGTATPSSEAHGTHGRGFQ